MSLHPPAATAVSAPGKVLLTGGYLVLDRSYTGTVFALDARIHVIVRQVKRGQGRGSNTLTSPPLDSADADEPTDTESQANAEGDKSISTEPEKEEESVVVRSPQFINALWEYKVTRCEQGGGVKVLQQNESPRNPFVETSLNYALTYISYVAASKNIGSLSVTILADNEYYSETTTSTGPSAQTSGRFKNFGVPLQEAHKTGLGSSAALVTALVSALVIHRTMHPDDITVAREKLHNLAQAAHCAAQGKVGSGFDVGAAVYGSCLYRRFTPTILERGGEVGSPGFEERLFSIIEDLDPTQPWDTECMDFGMRLPQGMQMVLCDVDCGSQTPSMVKKVLEWRKENPKEADMLWASLQANNEKLRQELKRLAHIRAPESDIDAFNAYKDVRTFIQRARHHLRTMTRKTGVPIEPRVQSELLDTVSEIEGVIGGVVPGAGGYDAVVLLIRDDAEVNNRLKALFETWKSTVEDDFGGKIEKVRLLGVKHGSEGVKNELLEQYVGWV